jgi:hypothetical protein
LCVEVDGARRRASLTLEYSHQAMIALLAFQSVVLAQMSFKKYSMVVSTSGYSINVAYDASNPKTITQGRASVVFASNPKLASYSLFNGTFQFGQQNVYNPKCTAQFVPGNLADIFDLDNIVENGNQTKLPNGDTVYSFQNPPGVNTLVPLYYGSASLYPQVGYSVQLATGTGNGEPTAMNLTYYGTYALAAWKFSNFSTNAVHSLNDSSFAPPPDACILKYSACQSNSTFQAVTMDFYRSHDNSSFAHVLSDANVADPAGECAFACVNNNPNPLAGVTKCCSSAY